MKLVSFSRCEAWVRGHPSVCVCVCLWLCMFMSGGAAGGCKVTPGCCCPLECWCCRPHRFTPSSLFSSSPSSTCCPWGPTSLPWAIATITVGFPSVITWIGGHSTRFFSSVFQYSFDNKTENFDDLPARFGYRLPSDGLKVSADPVFISLYISI